MLFMSPVFPNCMQLRFICLFVICYYFNLKTYLEFSKQFFIENNSLNSVLQLIIVYCVYNPSQSDEYEMWHFTSKPLAIDDNISNNTMKYP